LGGGGMLPLFGFGLVGFAGYQKPAGSSVGFVVNGLVGGAFPYSSWKSACAKW